MMGMALRLIIDFFDMAKDIVKTCQQCDCPVDEPMLSWAVLGFHLVHFGPKLSSPIVARPMVASILFVMI
uniref:Uncharacterized protein n=1 Tax=Fagus sylvatica TaxID=28930 RepID=A0A2N9GT29_FAGSY